MTAKIAGIGAYVPETIVTNDDLAKIIETNDEWISGRTGIRERRISTTERTSDLAAKAAERALDAAGVKPEDRSTCVLFGDGALAMAVANEVWMMENAIYSILSPEGFASILWKDSKRADEAAWVMKITAKELKNLGIIEYVIAEEEPASRENLPQLQKILHHSMKDFLNRWMEKTAEELVEHRYERFRKF